MDPRFRPGTIVKIDPYCNSTGVHHGLLDSRKKALMGTLQPIDSIRNETTIVIKKWHFHPNDLRIPYEDLKPVEKKEYKEIYFDVKEVLE